MLILTRGSPATVREHHPHGFQ
jgi:hypothetical protein